MSIVLYPLYPGDDADMEFMDAVIKSSLRAFWQTLNFENPPTNKKVMSRFDTVVYFSLAVTFLIVGGFAKFKICQKAYKEP